MRHNQIRDAILYIILGAAIYALGNEEVKEVQHRISYKEVKKIIYKEKEDKFTPEKFKEYLLELNLKYPEIIFAQARLETGNFTSRAFREQNNLFGLHVARQRPTLAKKGKGRLAHYSSWRDSVVDYAFLVADRMRKLDSREDYLRYLDANYDVPGYSKKLLKFI